MLKNKEHEGADYCFRITFRGYRIFPVLREYPVPLRYPKLPVPELPTVELVRMRKQSQQSQQQY